MTIIVSIVWIALGVMTAIGLVLFVLSVEESVDNSSRFEKSRRDAGVMLRDDELFKEAIGDQPTNRA